ncbi:hypothetical protein EIN_230900 [Entamoeba invadens IP1]|uniref:Uncharacterized protein n=1 Tax=Entamoeba invadens IP1 TaxID=370355 RepID=A0A0A1U350_ENTIV|nr:hypothetical protein EIN_230900 [Entamoeba invadens IP1]ELP88477.1 hypothetical protein EIN_230900 [Entamoeba invadens IP1]|eukprot:XP_004255248.1 hypothetical protein EIN_230900 [Entamoeba invadens IP1]
MRLLLLSENIIATSLLAVGNLCNQSPYCVNDFIEKGILDFIDKYFTVFRPNSEVITDSCFVFCSFAENITTTSPVFIKSFNLIGKFCQVPNGQVISDIIRAMNALLKRNIYTDVVIEMGFEDFCVQALQRSFVFEINEAALKTLLTYVLKCTSLPKYQTIINTVAPFLAHKNMILRRLTVLILSDVVYSSNENIISFMLSGNIMPKMCQMALKDDSVSVRNEAFFFISNCLLGATNFEPLISQCVVEAISRGLVSDNMEIAGSMLKGAIRLVSKCGANNVERLANAFEMCGLFDNIGLLINSRDDELSNNAERLVSMLRVVLPETDLD